MIDLPCGKTAGNLMQGIFSFFYIRSLTRGKTTGIARYPFSVKYSA